MVKVLAVYKQTLDFSKLVPHGFGTGDCVIVADDLLHIVDFKYGVSHSQNVRHHTGSAGLRS
ncbi:MAG: DUF2800 domain-containing protein [Eubacterium sp.]|nr:DUF2800 domain-containing protein [Eubacterium sp.]